MDLKKIELSIMRPFELLFAVLARRVNYTFATAFTTSIFGAFFAAYMAVFLSATLQFKDNSGYGSFVILFIALCLLSYVFGYCLHFGMLSGLGVPCFSSELNFINRHIRNNEFIPPAEAETSVAVLGAVERLPVHNIRAAFIYPLIVMAGVVIHQIITGTGYNALMMLIGLSTAIFINVFATYISGEFFTSDMRCSIKRYLLCNKIQFAENFTSSIRIKFIFITLFVFISMFDLGLIFYYNTTKGFSFLPVIFTVITSIIVGLLLLFYLLSIQYSFMDIESAAIDLARGGTGNLYIRAMDREVVSASVGFMQAAREVDDLRFNFENKINDRTHALNNTMDTLQNTLNEIQSLKQQQDGDYFLISLLLEPLNQNKASCVNLDIQFYLEEKKKFQFKKWKKELGGDLCIARSIFLKNKIYAVILNADAMGKSMQGAGGAIVLGAQLQAIIDRTRFSSMEQELHPEIWIQRAYNELQRVFESFNGSMLISMVLTLVDDDTGLMYYINAEHPWTVLYRRGRAEFIENELKLRKLGVPDYESTFSIKLFKIMPGDVILIGSDGRDDILIQGSGDEPAMNEDEKLFLKMVEKGKGNLRDIYKAITGTGDITDDYSMIRITYKEGMARMESEYLPEVVDLIEEARIAEDQNIDGAISILLKANKIQKNTPAILKKLARLLFDKKDYKGAVLYIDKYIELKPEDTELLFIASYCYMKTGNNLKAAEVAERIILRKPWDITYLLHIAKIYISLNNYFEADKILDMILHLNPGNVKALNLKNSM